MVGLSILLENQKSSKTTSSTIILNNKCRTTKQQAVTNHPSSSSSTSFLAVCFLCKQALLPGKDIYMYKGDRAFCSVDCRCKQILKDEDEIY